MTETDFDVGDGVVMDLGVVGGFVWDFLGVVLTKAGLYSSELPIFESVCKDQKKIVSFVLEETVVCQRMGGGRESFASW